MAIKKGRKMVISLKAKRNYESIVIWVDKQQLD
jgi:hypothetical protein